MSDKLDKESFNAGNSAVTVIGGQYQATPDTLSDNTVGAILVDAQGRLVTSSTSGTGASSQQVQGNVASGATDSGNPVKTGGVYNSSLPTFTSGQRGDTQIDANGNQRVAAVYKSGSARSVGDGTGNLYNTILDDQGNDMTVATRYLLYNGSTWDRPRTPSIFKPQSAVSIASEATVWTPTSGKKFRLIGGVITASVAGNITLKDNTAGTTIMVVPVSAGVPVVIPPMGNGILSAAANNVLTATGPAASTLSGTLFGTEE